MTPLKTESEIEAELKSLADARKILSEAHSATIGTWEPNRKVWHAIEYIDGQVGPIHRELLADPQLEGAA